VPTLKEAENGLFHKKAVQELRGEELGRAQFLRM